MKAAEALSAPAGMHQLGDTIGQFDAGAMSRGAHTLNGDSGFGVETIRIVLPRILGEY